MKKNIIIITISSLLLLGIIFAWIYFYASQPEDMWIGWPTIETTNPETNSEF
jgi:predicted negative regulator of RcsB-dependent stress response